MSATEGQAILKEVASVTPKDHSLLLSPLGGTKLQEQKLPSGCSWAIMESKKKKQEIYSSEHVSDEMHKGETCKPGPKKMLR